MKYPFYYLLGALTLAFPASAQEWEVEPETPQENEETVLAPETMTGMEFSRSLMFRQDALDKLIDLYDIYQARLSSGGLNETFTDNMDIDIEPEKPVEADFQTFSLNSILWDKGRWIIWVNGRKYEMAKKNDPIAIGSGLFHIVSVGKETASFSYQPDVQVRDVVLNNYRQKETMQKQWKSQAVKGEGVVLLDEQGGSYAFTLRPNQHFRAEYMILTEGKGHPPRIVKEAPKEAKEQNARRSPEESAARSLPNMPQWETGDEPQQ